MTRPSLPCLPDTISPNPTGHDAPGENLSLPFKDEQEAADFSEAAEHRTPDPRASRVWTGLSSLAAEPLPGRTVRRQEPDTRSRRGPAPAGGRAGGRKPRFFPP